MEHHIIIGGLTTEIGQLVITDMALGTYVLTSKTDLSLVLLLFTLGLQGKLKQS
jgi:hypothetical protein